ncbi:MAG: 1-deoxy-D-xylulose-5-phosphate synthase, partial [Clostridia bacterium]|nr:1-deoxy-D-xylulose-5-phosphate synthase [Clostridia bacterium]
MLLKEIKQPQDIKGMNIEELYGLAKEIRQKILNTVMETGGHLASSLGAVEIILALHYCFDCPNDKFVFDVGHQCYAHKLLTGRYEQFSTLRQFGGIAGFPKINESVYDVANTGHSSTSISLACGLSRALWQDNSSNITISVIGDGALTGGLAYEALNDCINLKKK